MPRRPSLLLALAPKVERRTFGVIPIFLAAGKGIGKGLKFLQSDKGKKWLKKLGDSSKKAEIRWKRAQKKYEQEKDPKAKARWKRRMNRRRAMFDKMRIKEDLAARGIVGRGPTLEYRRNLLAMEWEDSDADRKKAIEGEIVTMDKRLTRLKREIDLAKKYQGAPAIVLDRGSAGRIPLVKPRDPEREIYNGLGGMEWTTQSPPGSGRLARIPFYPAQDVNSWTGVGGLEHAGDDPILRLVVPLGSTLAPPLRMFVPKLDYGTYRLLGIQTNHQESYGLAMPGHGNGPIFSVAITVSNLQLYNGQQLFLQDPLEQIAADTFSILPVSTTRSPLVPAGFRFEAPYNYKRRRSRFFSGMRDTPVVSNNVEILLTVHAFINIPIPSPPVVAFPPLEIPFTANLIVDILEDKVFGDPRNPSPASRAGATVKVGVRELGLSWEQREQIEVVSPHFVPRTERNK